MADELKKLTEDSFKEGVSKGVTLVDFYADWCGPCRMMTPVLVKLSAELQGKASIVKLDIDHAQDTARIYQVTSVPTLILFKDGKEVGRLVGLRDAETVKKFVLSAN